MRLAAILVATLGLACVTWPTSQEMIMEANATCAAWPTGQYETHEGCVGEALASMSRELYITADFTRARLYCAEFANDPLFTSCFNARHMAFFDRRHGSSPAYSVPPIVRVGAPEEQ